MPSILTHYLLSYIIASRIVRKRIALLISIFGVLPDIDALLHVHRWITHSLVLLCVIAIPIVIMFSSISKLKRFRILVLTAIALYCIHIVADLFVASTPMLWPITNYSYYIKFEINGVITSSAIYLKPLIAVYTTRTRFDTYSRIEGPIATPTSIFFALAILVLEIVSVLNKRFPKRIGY